MSKLNKEVDLVCIVCEKTLPKNTCSKCNNDNNSRNTNNIVTIKEWEKITGMRWK